MLLSKEVHDAATTWNIKGGAKKRETYKLHVNHLFTCDFISVSKKVTVFA